jgi:hypothetical protein
MKQSWTKRSGLKGLSSSINVLDESLPQVLEQAVRQLGLLPTY